MSSETSSQIQRAIARSIGKAACVYAYPLVELLRMCRLQTSSRFDLTHSGRASIDTLHHSDYPPTERGMTSPIESRLYTTAWIYLSDGPRYLHLPAGWPHRRHRLRATLYDAHTEKLAAFGWDGTAGLAMDLLLVGPHTQMPQSLEGRAPLKSATDMVWLVAQIDVDGDDIEGAFALQSEIVLDGPANSLKERRPPAVDLWEGDASDALVDVLQRYERAASVAPMFYANLCRALAHAPARPEDQHWVDSFRKAGLAPGASLDWSLLMPSLRQGLVEGFDDAAECIRAGHDARQRVALAGAPAPTSRNYLARAVASYGGGHLQTAADDSAARSGAPPRATRPT